MRLEKEKKEDQKSQSAIREQLTILAGRLENIQRSINVNRIQMSNLRNQIKQKIEEATLNRVSNLDSMGLVGTDESTEDFALKLA